MTLPQIERQSLDPFVFLDYYKHNSKRGIGDKPHPHAGIAVYTYLIKVRMEHSDSRGFKDVLGQGDSQWIRAGGGILHAEKPSMSKMNRNMIIGNPYEVKQELFELQTKYQADEIMINTITYPPKDRIQSYELIAKEIFSTKKV